MKNRLYFFLLLICFWTPLQAQWSANIFVNSNLPPALDQITENPAEYVTISVNNTSLNSADGVIQITVRNLNANWFLSSGQNALPVTFNPGQNNLTLVEIEDAFEGIGPGDIGGNIPPQQQELIERGYLPGGEYELCLAIYDPISGELLLQETCEQFSICIGSRPILLTPIEEVIRPEDYLNQNIPFTWQPATCDNGMGMLPVQVNYTFKMLSLTELGVEEIDESMFEGSAVPFFEETDIIGNSYIYNEDMVAPDLQLGHRYAVQIIASTDEGDYYFNENGRSEVYVFQFGQALSNPNCNNPDYQISAEFPLDGDTLPYSFVPCIGHFEPYCDEYRRFDFDFSISDASGASHARSDRNNWPEGPLEYLGGLIGEEDADEYRAARGVFNLKVEQEGDLGTLERGENYTWSAQTEMTIEGGDTYSDDIDPQTFVFGMPKPQLNEPPNGATVPPGDITFNWLKGNIPDELLPDFIAYLRAEREDIEGRGTIGNIRERGVFQLSTEPEFEEDDIIRHDVYDIAINDFTSEADLTNPVYGIEIHDDSLTAPGTYYWRVVYLRDPERVVPENGFIGEEDYYHPSEVYQLRIGEEEEEGDTINTECVAECELPEISNTDPKTTFSEGDHIQVGKFDMELTEVNVSGSALSGQGLVTIPFLNDVKMKCTFSGIQVNTDDEMYSGTVQAEEDSNPFNLSQNPHGIPYLDSTQLAEFDGFLFDNSRLASLLAGGEIGLPIGIDRTVLGKTVTMGIVEMAFHPRRASINAVAAIDVPELNWISSVGAADVCIQPEGFTTDSVILYQAYESKAKAGGGTFILKGGAPGEPETEGLTYNTCYAAFGCDGFSHFQIAMEVVIERDKLIPQNDEGEPSEDEEDKVKFQSAARYDMDKGLIARLQFDKPFYIAERKKVALEFSEGWLDLSSKLNPTDIDFPENYDYSALEGLGDPSGDSGVSAAWTGFYLKSLSIHLPEIFRTREESNTLIAVRDFIIDGSGITCSLGAYNVIEDGNIVDWEATLDTIELQITQSRFDRFTLNGKFTPPIADTVEGPGLKYSVVLDHTPAGASEDSGESESSTAFFIRVDVMDSVHFIARHIASKMVLYEDSYVEVGYEDSAYIDANFTGSISISEEHVPSSLSNVPTMNMPGIRFQNFRLSTIHGVSCDTFHFASPQKSASGFPLTINEMSLGGSLNEPQLDLVISLNFQSGENGLSGTGSFSILGELYRNANDNTKFRLTGVQFNGLLVRAEMSAMKLVGGICWQKDDQGERFDGLLQVELPSIGVGVGLEGTFGKVYDTDTDEGFRYWRVDAQVKFGSTGIPLFAGISLYALGGGFWHHMEMDLSTLPDAKAIHASDGSNIEVDTSATSDPCSFLESASASGATYTPNKEKFLGFRISAMLGTQGSSSMVNCEVEFIAEINNDGGLELLRIAGDVFVMQTMGEGGENSQIVVQGGMEIIYSNTPEEPKQVNGNFNVHLNVFDVLKGAAGPDDLLVEASFHASDDEWWFHMGKIEERKIVGGAKLKLSIPAGDEGIDLAESSTYLMVGHRIPNNLPYPPGWIREILGNSSQSSDKGSVEGESTDGLPEEVSPELREAIQNGVGMAFGMQTTVEVGLDAFIYFSLKLGIGFDLMIRKSDFNCSNAEGGEPGVNGWRAKGQAYLGLEGELGLQFKFFGKKKIPILYLGVAILMEAQAPNPSYFKGQAGVRFEVLGGVIKGQKTITFEAGERCQILIEDPLAEIRFIEDLQPQGTKVSVGQEAEALFAFSMEERMQLPKTIDEESYAITSYYEFEPEMTEFEIRRRNTTDAIQLQEKRWSPSDDHMKVLPLNWMDGQTDYEVYCAVKVKDYTDYNETEREANNIQYTVGDYYRDPEQPFVDWVEDSTVYFTTGEYPDTIPLSNVKFTYPLDRQRFYLQEESNGLGLLKVRVGMHSRTQSLFYDDKDGTEYEYVARFVALNKPEDQLETAFTPQSGVDLLFDVPELENEITYSLHLVRKPVNASASPDSRFDLSGNLSGSIGSGQLGQSIENRLTIRESFIRNELDSGYYDQRQRELNPSNFVLHTETNLFQYYFKTSRYNSLDEKIDNVQIDARTPSSTTNRFAHHQADVEISGLEEDFESYDLFGYANSTNGPLLHIEDTYEHDYWEETYASGFYSDMSRLVRQGSQIWMNGNGRYYAGFRWEDIPGITQGILNLDHPSGYPRNYPEEEPYEINSNTYHRRALSMSELQSSFEESSSSSPSPGIPGTGNNPFNILPSGGFNNSGTFIPLQTAQHFAANSGNLLVNYKLRKRVEDARTAARTRYGRFFYRPNLFLRVNRILYPNGNTNYDLTRDFRNAYVIVDFDGPCWTSIRDQHPAAYSPLRRVMGLYGWGNTSYITESYMQNTEFGTQWITNEYEFRLRYQVPDEIIGSFQYLIKAFIGGYNPPTNTIIEYRLEEDLSRFPIVELH
jgi:hypothetical protein